MAACTDCRVCTLQGPTASDPPVNSPAIFLHELLYVTGLIPTSICLRPLDDICWMKEGITLQSHNSLETEDASSPSFK